MKSENTNIVRFDNILVYYGSYNLSARALKLLCYIIASYINPKGEELPTSIEISLSELIKKAIPSAGKSKSIYQEIDKICEELMTPIRFSNGVEIDGYKLRGRIAWCSLVEPITMVDGSLGYRFDSHPRMAQFLLGLKQYVRLYRPEINRLRKSHAIRIFQMLKGIRNKRMKYEIISRETYEVEQLKFLLLLTEKYPKIKDFRRWVIKPSVEEINEKTTIKILDIKFTREGRKIKFLEFIFTDQQPAQSLLNLPSRGEIYMPSHEEIETLTWAKFNAYHALISFGVTEGIAFKQIIPSIKGSEIKGFEDYFIEQAIQIFKQKAQQQDAGTFVNWWTTKKVFDSSGDVWALILETILQHKKQLATDKPVAYDNRLVATKMSKGDFEKWYRQQNQHKKTNKTVIKENSSKQRKQKIASIGEILNKKF